jgi:mono/diheme cytochrome c family protein
MTTMAGVVLLAACAGTQIPRERIHDPGEMLFNGQVRADINCYECHDGDGTGTGRGPNLGKRVPSLTDTQIIAAIDDGPSIMPSFKDKLSTGEEQQILAWLRHRFPSR